MNQEEQQAGAPRETDRTKDGEPEKEREKHPSGQNDSGEKGQENEPPGRMSGVSDSDAAAHEEPEP